MISGTRSRVNGFEVLRPNVKEEEDINEVEIVVTSQFHHSGYLEVLQLAGLNKQQTVSIELLGCKTSNLSIPGVVQLIMVVFC